MSDSEILSLESIRANESWLRPLLRALVDDATASDVMQQTWLRAWQKPPRAPGALRAWLTTVATRLAISHRRQERRRQRCEAAVERSDATDSTLETVERLAVQRAVSEAVSGLAEPYRTTILLRHYHQLDIEVVAARTFTTAANVRQRLHRGLQSMRERLSRDLGEHWRRSPAVLALAVPAIRDGGALTAAAKALPLLIAMNKVRLTFVAVLIAVFVGGALFAPRLLAPDPGPPAPGNVAAATRSPELADKAKDSNEPDRSAVTARTSEPRDAAVRQGAVLDTKGRPVAEVQIGVTRESGAFESLAVSDGNGQFPVPHPWPAEEVVVAAPWTSLALRPPSTRAGASPPLLVVAPCRMQTVAVVDEQGWALLGTTAEVHCYGLLDFPQVLDDANENLPRASSSDESGRHFWRRLPLANTFVLLRKPGCLPLTVPIDESTPCELSVTLRSIAQGKRLVTGIVTNARGAYVAGARVGLGHWTTAAGPYGDFVLELEAGASTDRSQSLYAAHEGWYPAVVAGFGERLQAIEGAVAQNLQLQQPSLRITGRVVDVHGAPCAGVHVYPWLLSMLSDRETAEDLASPAGAPLSLTGNLVRSFGLTDAEGRFAVPGLGPRAYHLRVYDEKGGWAWTTPPIEGGTEETLVTLPMEPLGPVAGTLVTRDGGPAAGVTVDAYVEVFATEGGSAAKGLPISVQTDAEGHFRIAHMPRLGVHLGCGGKGWIEQPIELDNAAGAENLRCVMLRRCHVRVELADAAWANGKIRFLDANDALLAIVEERGNTRISREVYELHDGKTEVLAVSESAVLLAVTSADGKREQRLPIALRAGDIQIVR